MPILAPPALPQIGNATRAARAAAGIAPPSQGNGLLVGNGNQTIGRSLVPGPGVVIENPTGIAGDPRISAQPGRVLLGSRLASDLNVTTDQLIQVYEYARYIVTEIIVTNRSATPTSAAGGVYSTTGKGGYTLVPASQVYTGLTDAGIAMELSLASPKRLLTGPALYLSLTTANGAACTADVFVFGYWLPAA